MFNTAATAQSAFTAVFPNIDFNPAAGSVPGNNSGVSSLTRPFTDVATTAGGNFAGSVPAQGNGLAAGTASLYNFSAVFTGSLNVPLPGCVFRRCE